jgi:hypothetical protein
MQLVLGDTRMPNNIIHPTLAEVLGTGYRCFGRVMMSVTTSENVSSAANIVKQAINTGQSVL